MEPNNNQNGQNWPDESQNQNNQSQPDQSQNNWGNNPQQQNNNQWQDQNNHNQHQSHHQGQNHQHQSHHQQHENQPNQNNNWQQPQQYQQPQNQPNQWNEYPQQTNQHQSQQKQVNPGTIILQWLTYAFWGWTILAMSVLTGIVFYSLFGEQDTGTFTVYIIAATLVLLPISAVCDRYYSKLEPAKKHGAESLVMVIHAVIFALFAIGAVISAVFALVNMATSSSDSVGSKVTLFSALVIALLYAAVFLRTMDFAKFALVKKHFTKFMIVAVGIILVFGIIGPLAKTRATRDDRLITSNIYYVNDAIGEYARSNNKLPEKLSDLTLKGDSKVLVEKNLLKYTPNTKEATDTGSDLYNDDYLDLSYKSNYKVYYYTICATYKEAKEDKYSSSYDFYSSSDDGYSSSINTYEYPSGEVCYKLKTQDY